MTEIEITNLSQTLIKETFNPASKILKKLKSLYIDDPKIFLKNLKSFYLLTDKESASKHVEEIIKSPDPEMALNKLLAINERTDILPSLLKENNFSRGIIRFLGSSNFLGNFLTKNTVLLKKIASIGFLLKNIANEEHIENLRALLVGKTDLSEKTSLLKFYKYSDYIRITFLNLTGALSMEETAKELSGLADALVQICIDIAHKNISENEKINSSHILDFAVCGLGKLGGEELNYSSDIDLIYIYDLPSEDIETNQIEEIKKHYTKLSLLITKLLSEKSPQGFLYRVDLRLRPDGDRGPVCMPLSSILRYYEYAGRTWERSVFLRKRFIAGKKSVFDKFSKLISPFIFKKYLDYGTIDDLSDMKVKIETDSSSVSNTTLDIKNGRGGIREIEFFVHALQLINGGRITGIRSNNLLETLSKLRASGLITYEIADKLKQSYIFLREVEHSLQIKDETQTSKLPSSDSEIKKLALRTSCSFINETDTVNSFKQKIFLTMKDVRGIYDSLFSCKTDIPTDDENNISKLFKSGITDNETKVFLGELGFIDKELAFNNFNLLKNMFPDLKFSAKARKALRKVIPNIMLNASKTPEPDIALSNFNKFARSVRMHPFYFTLLKENPNTLKLLMSLFGTSTFLSGFLLKHPELLDWLVLAGNYKDDKKPLILKTRFLEGFSKDSSAEERLNTLRKLNNQEILRVALNEIHDSIDVFEAMTELSLIADSSVHFCYALSLNQLFPQMSLEEIIELTDGNKIPFTIVAMGKLGSKEFSYRSDLDLIFLYEENDNSNFSKTVLTKLAQKIISGLSLHTEEGYLYRVDMRLRPSGSRGVLVSSLDSFLNYHRSKSLTWEKQALLKARYLCGSTKIWDEVKSLIKETCYGKISCENIREITKIKDSIEKELATNQKEKYNFKSGPGGLLDLEFGLHILELKSSGPPENFKALSIKELLNKFNDMSILDKETYQKLINAYHFFSRLEHRLRLIKDRQTSSLEPEINNLHKIAKSFSPEYDGEKLLIKYKEYSKYIRDFYSKTIEEA